MGSQFCTAGERQLVEMSQGEKRDFLMQVELFQSLPQDQHAILSNLLEEEHYSTGHVLIRQGDEGHEFFIIKSGTVSVGVDGQKVATLGDGDYLGELALLRDEPRNATVTVETALTVFKITRAKFKEMRLNEKVEFKRRDAVAAVTNGDTVATQPPSVKTAGDRSLMLKALKSNLNLTSVIVLDDAMCNSMIDAAWEETVLAGTDLITQGSGEANYFYIVKSGSFEVFIDKPKAAKSVENAMAQHAQQVGVIQKGGSFGELALTFRTPRAATVRAQESCVVWVIDRETFKHILVASAESKAMAYSKLLDGSDFFTVLRKDEQAEVLKAMQEVSFAQDQIIFEQGDVGSALFVLVNGDVAMLQDGRETKRIKSKPDKAEIFGEMVLLKQEPRAATVKVVSATAKALSIDRTTFELLLGPFANIKKRGAGGESMVGKQGSNVQTSGGLIKRRDLKVLGLLGFGGFGAVELVEHVGTGKTYALKSLSKGHVCKCAMQEATLREKKVHYMCDSNFVVKLYECFNSEGHLMFLLELALGGDLHVAYSRNNFYGSEGHAKFYLASAVFAVEHLHSKSIVYRDLKLENLMLTEKGFVKLTDFCFAKVVVGKTNTTCGTLDYIAPEIIEASGHSLPVDWWALGVLAFEMIAGHPPFESPDPATTMKMIKRGVAAVRFPPKLKSDIEDFVKSLLQNYPMGRLPMKSGGTGNIKKHDWFKGFDWSAAFVGKLDPPYAPNLQSQTDRANFSANAWGKPPQAPYKDDGSGWEKDFATSS